MTLGVRDFEPTRRDWQECLGGLGTADGQELPACVKAQITRECRRLHQVIVMIAEVDEVFFRDFRNRREVAGYLGLASSP